MNNVALLVTGDNAPDCFDGHLIGCLADDQTVGLIARFKLKLPGLEAKGDPRAWLEDGFIERVLSQLASDLAEIGAKVYALPFDLMAGHAAYSGISENFFPAGGIAFHLQQLA